ncbi:unnamed protein product [Rotaria sordida]|uniref:Uncharacterized protein n=1 Tax=Rotaria sordida TaxID=392033 RepID=A0A815VEX4_9BILA|nr:unnamed protein product [Rotaria sordida]
MHLIIQGVIDDIEDLQQFNVDIYMEKDLFLSWIEAKTGLHHQRTINEFEIAQNKCNCVQSILYYFTPANLFFILDGHDFKSIIRNLKAFNIKKLFERNKFVDIADHNEASSC